MSWLEFARDYHIPYRRGSGSDNIEIHCPWCGPDDRSMHMGLSLTGSKYGCWRSEEHRGLNPTRLMYALIGSKSSDLKVLARAYFGWVSPEPTRKCLILADVPPVTMPSEFREFTLASKLEGPFINYLQERNLEPKYAISRFGLRYALSGDFKNRIIVPIITEKKLRTYTGRLINNLGKRYHTANQEDVGTQPADFLYDWDNIKEGGDLLIVTEGVFDAMAITSAFIPRVAGTCIFGKSIRKTQIMDLQKLASKYEKVAISLDRDAFADTVKLTNRLKLLIPGANWDYTIPLDKDWGSCSKDQIATSVKRLKVRA